MSRAVFLVHSLTHAEAALRAAAERGAAVTLRAPFATARALGPAVFREIVAEARRRVPDADSDAVFDCGVDSGLALAAVRAGVAAIGTDADQPARGRIADIAAQAGMHLIDVDPADGTTFDLAGTADSLAAARAFLCNLTRHREPPA